MNYTTLCKELKKGHFAPVYFFYGEEKFAIDQATQKVIEHSVPEEVRDFNLDVLYASETDSGKVLDIVKSYPMMSERRTVVIKDIQKFSVSHLKKVAEYTARPTPTTVLILIATSGRIRGKNYDLIKRSTETIEFKPLYDNQVGGWIKRYVNDKGKDISVQAIQILHAYVGNSQMNLVNELEKVFLNLGDRPQIHENDIESVVGFSKEFNIFNLIKVIGNKNLKAGMLIINNLLEHGEQPTGMIIRLANYFSSLLKFLAPQNRGKSDRDLAKIAGVNFYFVKDYRAEAKNFSLQKIEKAFSLLEEADLHLKTGYQTPKFVMQLLIYNLIRL